MTNKYDKLVKLLNEYREKEHGYNVPEWEEKELSLPNCYIISRELGFIKWLVDNDKINFIKLIQKQGNWEIDNIELNPIKELEYYKLLMLLAIQDEPIEFLCSILK